MSPPHYDLHHIVSKMMTMTKNDDEEISDNNEDKDHKRAQTTKYIIWAIFFFSFLPLLTYVFFLFILGFDCDTLRLNGHKTREKKGHKQ